MAPVSRRSFLAGVIAAPVLGAVGLKAAPKRTAWKSRMWFYGGNAGGGKSAGVNPNLGQIVSDAWERVMREQRPHDNIFNTRAIYERC